MAGWMVRCPDLVKLNMSSCRLVEEEGQALGEALRWGACTKLEDLSLYSNSGMDGEGFKAIIGALEAGGCPSLKRLNLEHASLSVDPATALGHAVRSGHCQHLQRLDLNGAFDYSAASLCLLQAIQQGGGGGGLPNLRYLDVKAIEMDQEHGRVLGAAIEGGALPALEELDISWNRSLDDDGLLPIMASLDGGGCRHLKQLQSHQGRMGPQGGHALGRALASGHLSCLQSLIILKNARIGDEAMAEVIMGLRQCHQLRELIVRDTGMGAMAGQALVQALQDKVWPVLQVLDASDNGGLLSDGGVVVDLVEVLEEE